MRKRKKEAGERRRRAWGKGSEPGGERDKDAGVAAGVGVVVIGHVDFVAANVDGGGGTAGGRGGEGVYGGG